MDGEFKEWLIQKFDNLGEIDRRNFFLVLRNRPESIGKIILAHFVRLQTSFELEAGMGLDSNDIKGDVAELVESLRSHFAKEMETIPAQQNSGTGLWKRLQKFVLQILRKKRR